MSHLLYFLLFAFVLGHCHAQRDNYSLQDGFSFPGPAERPEKFPLNGGGSRPTTSPPTVNSPSITTPNPNDVANCIQRCPVTSEYNPVCGTDNVQYSNPGRLSCTRLCTGMPMDIQKYGKCSDNNIRG